jgi:pimeloyl-ACP methyl ester carboxylesterase
MGGARLHTILRCGIGVAGLLCGCGDLQYYIPATNCDAPQWPPVELTERSGIAAVGTVPGVSDAQWLQIERQRGPGLIGGYVAPEASPRGSLVLLLGGAGTLHKNARVEAVLSHYRDYGIRFRHAGFRVWAPVLSEADPYGTTEVDDVVEILEWLDGPGRVLLGIDRVFVVGYSTGATTAGFANLRAPAAAVVALAPLTEPNQLIRLADLYGYIADLFPCNTGLQQFRHTLDYYGAVGWGSFDVVTRVGEMRNPALFVTAEDDIVYGPVNVRDLEQAYRAALASGTSMPELTFEYLTGGGHFVYITGEDSFALVRRYLERFE